MTRYTWRDWDTHGEVVEHATGRVVSTHDLISDAEAEAARLNASGQGRLLPTDVWVLLHGSRAVAMSQHRHELGQLPWKADMHGIRIARVRITEIEQEAGNAL